MQKMSEELLKLFSKEELKELDNTIDSIVSDCMHNIGNGDYSSITDQWMEFGNSYFCAAECLAKCYTENELTEPTVNVNIKEAVAFGYIYTRAARRLAAPETDATEIRPPEMIEGESLEAYKQRLKKFMDSLCMKK